jgi:hypothetical protein
MTFTRFVIHFFECANSEYSAAKATCNATKKYELKSSTIEGTSAL